MKRIAAILACASALVGGVAHAQTSAVENMPLWRIQLRVQTCNVSDAGTDDGISVSLADGVTFDLDTGADDFERNTTRVYDIVSDRLPRVSSITRLELANSGDDGVCIQHVDLLFNNVSSPFFSHDMPSARRWIDTDGYRDYRLTSAQIRGSLWNLSGARAAAQTRPQLIAREIVESMTEASVGEAITGNDLMWGGISGRPVESWYVAGAPRTRMHTDLDLEVDIPGPFNPDVDVDYDANYSCADNRVNYTTSGMRIETGGPDWVADLFGDVSELVTGALDSQLGMLAGDGLRSYLPAGGFTGTFAACPTSIRVNDDASIAFQWPSSPVLVFTDTIFMGVAR